jgi:hypothetical protein
MKYFIALAACALLMLVSVQSMNAVNLYTQDDVAISSTTASLIVGIVAQRRYLIMVNVGTCDVRLSTYPQAAINHGLPLKANGGSYIDEFDVIQSSWYAVSCGTNTAGSVSCTQEK